MKETEIKGNAYHPLLAMSQPTLLRGALPFPDCSQWLTISRRAENAQEFRVRENQLDVSAYSSTKLPSHI